MHSGRIVTGTRLICCLLVAWVVAACGERAVVHPAPQAEQRRIAAEFAAALLHGDSPGASGFLVPDGDGSRGLLVELNTAPWQMTQRVSIQPSGRAGDSWRFHFVRRRTLKDGGFKTQRGSLVVFVRSTAAGAGIEYFVFSNVRTRFSTHHDSQLLPSNR